MKKEDTVICECCEQPTTDYIETEDGKVCQDCIEKYYRKCSRCGVLVNIDACGCHNSISGGVLCECCYGDLYE